MKCFSYSITIIFLTVLCLFCSCSSQKKTYHIGVSQCSEDEWRTQMNNEILREALFYPDVQIDIVSANDQNQKQIADIKSFIDQNVDLLIVSPNEAEAIKPVVEEAYDKGIPVILVDRKVNTEKFTAFVGADNYKIGEEIGHYIDHSLPEGGNVVELRGLIGSTPASERHDGLSDVLKKNPNIQIVATEEADWQASEAQKIFDSILTVTPNIDVVFAHNDRMASGAYEAARKHKREKEIRFIGIDALTGKDFGVEQVIKGKLEATFIYPTGGDVVMQTAMNILTGKPYERNNILSTALVNQSNARIMQMQTSHIHTLDNKIETLNTKLNNSLSRYMSQRMLLYACIVILILTIALMIFLIRAFQTKNRMNAELSQQKNQLEKQRDQLITLSSQVEKATRDKLAFFTNVSHDLRTPLTLISDPVEQLLGRTDLKQEERSLLQIIQKNATVLLRLINQILDFRKFEEGKLSLTLSQFNIADEIKEWTEAFRTLSYRKHIHFQLNIDESATNCIMTADIEKIERIVYNLLSNAFKFTPENGSVIVELSQYEQNGPHIRLNVKDTGVGISVQHVEHIFESFYQADTRQAGSGIGLALAKAFVEMHNGTINVQSAENKGTSFIIELPLKQEGPVCQKREKNDYMSNFKEGAVLAADQESLQSGDEDVIQQNKETVLVIDDNQDIRDYLKILLRKQYTVIVAANGREGIQMAMKYIPDAIICDVMMPVMDGLACCKRLKSEIQTSHIPILMLTAYSLDEQKVKGYESGADSYILKPFSSQLLLTRLKNLIENRKRLQNFFADKTNVQKEPLAVIDQTFVEKLRSHIERNLSNPNLSVEDLGEKIGMSRVQLYRKTKALTGYSPNELIRITRLKKAATLLASTNKTIAEITYEVGFSTPSYFTKCYKEFFGENPTDFLKRKEK